MRVCLILVLAGLSGLVSPAAAQFQIPLPRHVSSDIAYHIYSAVCDSVRAGTLDSLALAQTPRFTKRISSSKDSVPVTTTSCLNHWLTAADAFRGVARGNNAVRAIYGDSGINVLANLAGSFKSDRMYVQTAVFGGVIGPLYVNASYGQFFSSQESTEPGITRQELRYRV
jgi:hypothetical protein